MAENYYPATYRDKDGKALAFSTTADRVFDGTTSVAAEISALQTGKATAAQGAEAEALTAALNPTAYSIAGLTLAGCTISDGGYVKIGKLVLLNISVTLTQAITTSADIVTGFPSPLTSLNTFIMPAFVVDGTSSGYASVFGASGTLRVFGTAASGKAIVMSGVYVAAS